VSNLSAQIGFGVEVTPGTRVAPTRFLPLLSEDLTLSVAELVSQGIRSGRRTDAIIRQGKKEVSGGVQIECAPQGIVLLLRNALGAATVSGAGPYTHTITPGNLDDDTFSAQIVLDDDAGTDFVRDYTGLTVTDWSLEASVDDYLKLGLSLYGMQELAINTNTRAAASYPSGFLPLVFTEQSVTIGGSSQPVHGFRVGGANNVQTGRHRIRASAWPLQAKEQGRRQYTGEVTMDLSGVTQYNRFVNGTEAALVFTCTQSTHSLTVTMNVWFGGTTPTVSGPEGRQTITAPFRVLHATSDASALQIVVVNGDASA
jgi:hypothetical protein